MDYDLNLEIITPVIINSGDFFEFCEIFPTDKLSKNDPNSRMDIPESYRFNQNRMDRIFNNLSSNEIKSFIEQSSNALLSQNNEALTRLRRDLMSKCSKDVTKVPGRMLEIAHEELSKKPMQKVDKIMQNEINGFAYIPGSSVKGAMRTAILEHLRKTKKIESCPYNQNRRKELEAAVMGFDRFKVEDDPFKYMKVSDLGFDGLEAMQYIARVGDDNKMPIYSAMTNSLALSGNTVVAKGTLSIADEFYTKLNLKNDIDSLMEMLDDFYINTIWNSEKVMDAINTSPRMKSLQKVIGDMWNNDYHMLRLGHYIGIQNYTFKIDQTQPPRKARKDINKTGGRIVKIEGGIIPGVCMMKVKEAIS